jgi:hypothetical protein
MEELRMDIDLYFSVNGAVNTAKIRRLSDDEINEIKRLTSFLKTDATISQRIRTIKSGVVEHPKCPCCEKYLPFSLSKDKLFNEYCSISCAKKGNFSPEIGIKFQKSLINSRAEYQQTFETAKIVEKAEVVDFLKNNIDKFKGGGSKGLYLLKNNPEIHKSLLYYTSSKKLNAKIYEIINGPGNCLECGTPTNFISLEKGFSPFCEEHGKARRIKGSITRGLNSINRALDLLNGFDNIEEYEFICVPKKLNDVFEMKHISCGETFKLFLGNGKTQTYILRCPKCQNNSISSPELEIKKWIESKGIQCISQYKVGSKTIDLYIPEFNFAIEYHGLMYHSFGKSEYSKFNNYEKEDPKNHLNRLNLCLENSINLLQIFENEWKNKPKKDIWLSTISSKLNINEKIFARKCEIIQVDKKIANQFLNDNHLQGYTKTLTFSFGLMYNNELVSLITIGKSRFSGKYDWEIIRYCNKKYTNVIGGFSKLLKHFRKLNQGKIVSYANKRWSNGNLYEKNGFILIHDSSPNYFYFAKKQQLHSRNQFQKHKLKNILDSFDPNLTEKENMFENGYRRIWDCGNKVYVLE